MDDAFDGYVPPPESWGDLTDTPRHLHPVQDEYDHVRAMLVPGGTFVLDAPEHVPAIWGAGDQVLWGEGESLILAGPPGVGKTTLAGQVVRGRIIGGDVLGMPVTPTDSRILYLAMDRPRQIARALRRTLGGMPRELLDERIVFWPGPPLADVAKHPGTLKALAELAGADTVVIDSVKDAAIGLSDDDVGAGYNRARQMCIASGIELLELHHLVKRGINGAKPNTLNDLYGSVWLTAGAGSVVLLYGEAGDLIVDMKHLKTPAEEVGPWKVAHDHDAGSSSIWHSADLVTMAKVRGADGLTAKAAAIAMFETDKPSAAQVEKARRKLDRLAKAGQLAFTEGDRASARPAVWTFTGTFTDVMGAVTLHGHGEPSRNGESEHANTFTNTFTTITAPDLHASTPLFTGGGAEAPDAEPTCSTCGRRLSRSEQTDPECIQCRRIREAT